MAAPQRNYPYNPYLANAVAFNRNDPQYTSVMSVYGSDGGHEGEVLPQALQPGAGGHQVQQGPNVPNVAEVAEGVPAGQNTLPVEPALIAANTSAAAGQALAVGAPGSAGPSSAATASDATEEVVAQVNAHPETVLLQVDRAGSQPEAGPSSGASHRGHSSLAADISLTTNGFDPAHETTFGPSTSSTTKTNTSTKSRRGRKGAATPNRQPRRSLRESALRTAQRVHEILVPRPRRGRRSTAAANSGGPSTSTPISTLPTPPAVESAASTSRKQDNTSNEKERGSKAGLSAKALGKRRRIEPEADDEDEDVDELAPSDVEGASPAKKARRVRNLRNRSTPARFDIPKEESAAPSPSLPTPKRKRASNDEEERSAGPSKRGRVVNTEAARAPLLGPILFEAAPRRAWSVEAEPSVVGVAVRPVVVDARPPVPPAEIVPPFMVVLPELGPQPQQQPRLLPPPPPHPLRRTFAKIFIRGG